MDSKRFPKSRQIHLFRTAFSKKMATLRLYAIDVVGDDNAFSFAQREQHRVFRKMPILFLAVNNIDRAIAQTQMPRLPE